MFNIKLKLQTIIGKHHDDFKEICSDAYVCN